MQSSDVFKDDAARDQTFSSVFAYKSRNRSQIKSVVRMTNLSGVILSQYFSSTNKVRCIRKTKAMLFECHFRVNICSIYLNTTESSLTHNSLHKTTKKTHSLQSKRQIILCLPRNYCLAIHVTPLKSIFSCAKNSADKELSVKMLGLIMCMFRPSPKTLYLRSFAFFFRPGCGPIHFYCPVFSRIESVMRHE